MSHLPETRSLSVMTDQTPEKRETHTFRNLVGDPHDFSAECSFYSQNRKKKKKKKKKRKRKKKEKENKN